MNPSKWEEENMTLEDMSKTETEVFLWKMEELLPKEIRKI